MTEASSPSYRLSHAAPFWLSLGLIPVVWLAAINGGFALLMVPLSTWWLFSVLDAALGKSTDSADPATPVEAIRWHRLITLIWPWAQVLTTFGVIAYATRAAHLATWEILALAGGLGILSGTIGINYAHELLHQRTRLERWLSDILLAMVLYSAFRSEHLLVHHRYVATPRDSVTARRGANFHRVFPRAIRDTLISAWTAEAGRLTRKGLPFWHRSNPFWRYAALQGCALALAAVAGGWMGVLMFVVQAAVAVWQLELVNYVEHYGLTRRHLGEGRYEHVQPHHSWNAAETASNWLLINLQRHSDHHFKPDRRFPLLQSRPATEAPQLPYGYPVMTMMALYPRLWWRVMNPRVDAWRAQFYPDIVDWTPYNRGTTPMPR